RGDRGGEGQQPLVRGASGFPRGIALDLAGGKIYWAAQNDDSIQRSNLDGTERQTLVRGVSHPLAVALDLAGGKIYWTESGTGRIGQASLDGTGARLGLTG